jgi:large subunit ribosomal protein L33
LGGRQGQNRLGGGTMAAIREIISLQCTECKRKNYTTTKNRKTMTEKLELKKFCRHDRKRTVHREVK